MGTFLSRNELPCSLTQQAESIIKELGDGCSTFPKLNPRLITASWEHPALWCGTNGMVLSTWCDQALNHLGIKCLSLYSMGSVLLPMCKCVESIRDQILPKFSARKSWACVICGNKHNKPLERARTKPKHCLTDLAKHSGQTIKQIGASKLINTCPQSMQTRQKSPCK